MGAASAPETAEAALEKPAEAETSTPPPKCVCSRSWATRIGARMEEVPRITCCRSRRARGAVLSRATAVEGGSHARLKRARRGAGAGLGGR